MLNSKMITNISYTKDNIASFEKMINNLNQVIYLLIISACFLALIVLYNLTTINIEERIREIATLKVLGFNDKEILSYIYRETIILTLLGAILGVALGIILHRFVLLTIESDSILFVRTINGSSFMISFFLTMIFSVVVQVFTYIRLKKINMIESLKSVE
jgi:putative ABC transport system permease protein